MRDPLMNLRSISPKEYLMDLMMERILYRRRRACSIEKNFEPQRRQPWKNSRVLANNENDIFPLFLDEITISVTKITALSMCIIVRILSQYFFSVILCTAYCRIIGKKIRQNRFVGILAEKIFEFFLEYALKSGKKIFY